MQFQTRILRAALILIAVILSATLSVTCTRFNQAPSGPFEVSLHVGIKDIVELGDSTERVLEKTAKYKHKKISLSAVSAPPGVTFSEILHFPDLGVRIYFKIGRVCLIEIQEPFKGQIVGKELLLFEFKTPPGDSWRDKLVQEFGPPLAEVSGGRLQSFTLFYSWGDVAFNRMGPNELALHRDADIVKFREINFGRVVSFFD